jgi:hypothetical protein
MFSKLLIGSLVAATVAFSVPASAQRLGIEACVQAGNTRAYCAKRHRDIDAGRVQMDGNFGHGATARGENPAAYEKGYGYSRRRGYGPGH